ncbi:tyrosine-type recombinase/integrase [Mesorhizobium sp.]|uniref:tyrosine-type recombinase/integrase n=1 Tax=Mesorhizobium sp. TaxID=1871066 RepID=UPI000FE8FB20|nr:tyrosine-type recombinase/integrase [Mesorhizobium sp.]RWK11851.1 MAG: site-specific integrase [Mesorhizobium sp.]TIQ49054.1 MAG: site-specific integrase [Mesorhizobium sp.]TIQ58867.1 MAG: site-specific integrase [Mesorhizobium sp.]
MASVRKHKYPNGRVCYQAVWAVVGKDGARSQKTKVFDKASDAKTYARRMADEVERRGIADPHKHSVREYLNRWLTTLRQKGEHSPTTLTGYRRNIDLLCGQVGHIALTKLSPYQLDQAYAELLKCGGKAKKPNKDGSRAPAPLSSRTVHGVHRCAHTAFEQARKWRFISENPARDATPPSPAPSPARAMSDDEIMRVWQAAKKAQAENKIYPGIDCMVLLLMLTGLRRSEVLGLCWDAVDLDAGKITVKRTLIVDEDGKPLLRDEKAKSTKSLRTVTIPAILVDRLRAHWTFTAEQMLAWGTDYRRDPLLVFPEAGGGAPNPSTWTIRLRQIMRQAKVKAVQPVHGYRHSAATAMIAAGVDIKTVQTRLGHSTPAITMALYVHPEEARDKGAADVLAARLSKAL